MKHVGQITIHRTNRDGHMMHIVIEDDKSSGKVIEITIKPEDLMIALTGLSSQEVVFELRDITNVGKTKLRKPLSFTICQDEVDFYGLAYDRVALEKFVTDNAYKWVEEGWALIPALGSHNSIGYVKDGILINVFQVKYE
jgi:hypothetical protein